MTLSRLLVIAGILLSLAPTAPAAEVRPNVLWIYLEDVSGWFSCYGDKMIQTPNIDALAARGTRFTRYYSPAGVCSPTRSANVLGIMQTTVGAHNHTSSRNNAAGTKHDGIGMIHLPPGVKPLPQIMRQQGWYTFNEGGKDDYNFVFSVADLYDFSPKRNGWGPPELLAGKCWAGLKPGQRFFGQVQLGGGKLGNAAPKVVDRVKVPVPPYYPDIPEVREEIAAHYDCLLKTDEQVGQIVAALKRDGHYENTRIFLFSDHGYRMHRHKQYIYEGGIHMPLIVAGPGIAQGAVRDDLVSGIDLAPTTLAAAGLAIPASMEGRDLFAASFRPREYVVAARDRCDHTIDRIRTIVTKRFQYLRNYLTDRPYMQSSYKDPWPVTKQLRALMAAGKMNQDQLVFFGENRPAEELYDLESDPHQIRNLAGDPKYATELERHRQLLANWIAETGDQGQQPESNAGLIQVLYQRGDVAVNPEYAPLRSVIERKPTKRPRG